MQHPPVDADSARRGAAPRGYPLQAFLHRRAELITAHLAQHILLTLIGDSDQDEVAVLVERFAALDERLEAARVDSFDQPRAPALQRYG